MNDAEVEVEEVQQPAAARSPGASTASVGQRDERLAPRLERQVVERDLLGHVGEVDLDEGLDGGVLVLGVRLEQPVHVADVGGEVAPCGPVAGIGLARRRRDGEQLGPDGLVDVAVEVDGDQLEAGQGGFGGGDRHDDDRAASRAGGAAQRFVGGC